jgi:hypothetical protein
MSFRFGTLALVGVGLSLSSPVHAQVMADIHVGPLPVEGRVIIGPPHVVRGEPVLVRRPVTYLLPVQYVAARSPKWFYKHGWRPATVWFDGRNFIHPASMWRPTYREVVVLERGGRYLVSDLYPIRGYDRTWHDGDGRYDRYYDDRRRGDRDWQRKRWNDDNRDWGE